MHVLDLGYSQKYTDAGLVHLKELTVDHAESVRPQERDRRRVVHLKGLTNLTTLTLNGTKVTGAGLASLKGMTKLQTLNLMGLDIGDAEPPICPG